MDRRELHNAQERSAYDTLRQVLQNHRTTHAYRWGSVVHICVKMLTDRCIDYCLSGDSVPAIVEHCTTWLKVYVKERASTGPHTPPEDFDREAWETAMMEDDDIAETRQAFQTYRALNDLLHETARQHRWYAPSALRVVMSLTADVLAELGFEDDELWDDFLDELGRDILPRWVRQHPALNPGEEDEEPSTNP